MTPQILAPHVLVALARTPLEGRRATLASLCAELGVRKADVRQTVTLLHGQGYVDALRMRPTLAGFVLGRALAARELPALRRRADLATNAA